jgi:hypothetical protein
MTRESRPQLTEPWAGEKLNKELVSRGARHWRGSPSPRSRMTIYRQEFLYWLSFAAVGGKAQAPAAVGRFGLSSRCPTPVRLDAEDELEVAVPVPRYSATVVSPPVSIEVRLAEECGARAVLIVAALTIPIVLRDRVQPSGISVEADPVIRLELAGQIEEAGTEEDVSPVAVILSVVTIGAVLLLPSIAVAMTLVLPLLIASPLLLLSQLLLASLLVLSALLVLLPLLVLVSLLVVTTPLVALSLLFLASLLVLLVSAAILLLALLILALLLSSLIVALAVLLLMSTLAISLGICRKRNGHEGGECRGRECCSKFHLLPWPPRGCAAGRHLLLGSTPRLSPGFATSFRLQVWYLMTGPKGSRGALFMPGCFELCRVGSSRSAGHGSRRPRRADSGEESATGRHPE